MLIHVYHKNQLEAEALAYLLIENGYRAAPRCRSGSTNGKKRKSLPGISKPELLLVDASVLDRLTEMELSRLQAQVQGTMLLGGLRDLHHLLRHPNRFPVFICKKVTVQELLEGVQCLFESQCYLCRRVREFLHIPFPEQQRLLLGDNLQCPLSKSELEVLAEVAKGKTSRKIAQDLYRSRHTINNHRKNAMNKLAISGTFSLGLFTQVMLDELQTLLALNRNKSQIKKLLGRKE